MCVRSALLVFLALSLAACVMPTRRQRLAAARRDDPGCVARGWLAPPALPAYRHRRHVMNEKTISVDRPAYAHPDYGYRVPPVHPDLQQIIARCQ